MSSEPTTAEVLAVIVALADGEPVVLTVGDKPRLPAGPLLPSHRSLQTAVRAWVEEQTGLQLGFLEQLYTFADRDRSGVSGRTISVSYLGLTGAPALTAPFGRWRSWYSLLPWEDRTPAAPGSGTPAGSASPPPTGWRAGRGRRRTASSATNSSGRRAWSPSRPRAGAASPAHPDNA